MVRTRGENISRTRVLRGECVPRGGFHGYWTAQVRYFFPILFGMPGKRAIERRSKYHLAVIGMKTDREKLEKLNN